MPAIDVSNPKVIRFLLENYEKESLIRMKWVKDHASNFEKASTFTKKEKNYKPEDITKATIEAGMAATTRDHITAARFKTTASVPDFKLESVKTNIKRVEEVSMNPTTPELKETLIESSKEYLKKRSLLKPEEKYNFIECSNWKYGWKLNESMLKMRGPEYGKVNHVMHHLHSRVGPQRDPDHYKSPDPGQKVFDAL